MLAELRCDPADHRLDFLIADVAGMRRVSLLRFLPAAHPDFFRVDHDDKVAGMQCLPDNLRERRYYHPTREGLEKQIAERMEEIRKITKKK